MSNLFSRLRTGRQTLCQPNQIHHNSLQMNQNCRNCREVKIKRERESEREAEVESTKESEIGGWGGGGAWGAGRSAQTACREHVSGG